MRFGFLSLAIDRHRQPAPHIFFVRHWFQMIRVHAARHAADVIKLKLGRDFSVAQFVRQAMCINFSAAVIGAATNAQYPITGAVITADP